MDSLTSVHSLFLYSLAQTSESRGKEFFMKRLKLTKGYYTLLDDEDYFLIKSKYSEYKPISWCDKRNPVYIRASLCKYDKRERKTVFIQVPRLIMNAPKGKVVDHINRDTLDNRKTNLRICGFSENIRNCKMRKNNTSGYRGVTYQKKSNRWNALIMVNRKSIYLGYYKTAKEASVAYQKFVKEKYGNYFFNL